MGLVVNSIDFFGQENGPKSGPKSGPKTENSKKLHVQTSKIGCFGAVLYPLLNCVQKTGPENGQKMAQYWPQKWPKSIGLPPWNFSLPPTPISQNQFGMFSTEGREGEGNSGCTIGFQLMESAYFQDELTPPFIY